MTQVVRRSTPLLRRLPRAACMGAALVLSLSLMALASLAIGQEIAVRKVQTETIPLPERNPHRSWEANGYITMTVPMPKGWSEIGGAEVYGPIEWFNNGDCK